MTTQDITTYYQANKEEVDAAWARTALCGVILPQEMTPFIHGYCTARLTPPKLEFEWRKDANDITLIPNLELFCSGKKIGTLYHYTGEIQCESLFSKMKFDEPIETDILPEAKQWLEQTVTAELKSLYTGGMKR